MNGEPGVGPHHLEPLAHRESPEGAAHQEVAAPIEAEFPEVQDHRAFSSSQASIVPRWSTASASSA